MELRFFIIIPLGTVQSQTLLQIVAVGAKTCTSISECFMLFSWIKCLTFSYERCTKVVKMASNLNTFARLTYYIIRPAQNTQCHTGSHVL